MNYQQITSEERYTISTLLKQGFNQAQIARAVGRHPSSISRELQRNRYRYDGAYRPFKASRRTRARRRRSRRNFRIEPQVWDTVVLLLKHEWSPEQIACRLNQYQIERISHETFYKRIWADKKSGGVLYKSLRGSEKLRRKGQNAQRTIEQNHPTKPGRLIYPKSNP